MKINSVILAAYVSAIALCAQSTTVNPGDPLPGLSAEELHLFQSGRAEFLKEVVPSATAAAGEKPRLARASSLTCSGCHQFSAIGGAEYTFEQNAGRRISTPLFGAGLIEGIPDDAILALQNRPEDLALGIRGRAAMVVDSTTGRLRVGRFGWKAQHATLLDATVENRSIYLGVSESDSRNEIPDPASGLRAIDRLAAFSRLLAPVARITSSAAEIQGRSLFNSIGCANCHRTSITTAPVGTVSGSISPFSDFLLHDIGTGDGVAQGAASAGEFRTAPLWGLRLRRMLLHDGSAETPTDAIRAHWGEATVVRQRFDALSVTDRQAVIEFLKTL